MPLKRTQQQFYYIFSGMVVRPLWRLVTVLVALWGLIVIYMAVEFFQSNDMAEHHAQKLAQMMTELDILKKQNIELSKYANELK